MWSLLMSGLFALVEGKPKPYKFDAVAKAAVHDVYGLRLRELLVRVDELDREVADFRIPTPDDEILSRRLDVWRATCYIPNGQPYLILRKKEVQR